MRHHVLGIGYLESEYDNVRAEWKNYDLDFCFVDTVEEAVCHFQKESCVCITVCADRIKNGSLDYLRQYNPPPVILISSACSLTQRANLLQRGAVDYLINATNQWQAAQSSGKDAVQYYLDSPDKASEPLTIVTAGELYFCLEYHTVEVRGIPVSLTPKEFDLLALMIAHPQRVYTYEIISEMVWNQIYDYSMHKTIINHISSLRNKLRVAPDLPKYIVTVSKVGFKFDCGK